MMNDTEYKVEEAVYTKQLNQRILLDRHSLHFVFVPCGELKYIDWFKVFTLVTWLTTVYGAVNAGFRLVMTVLPNRPRKCFFTKIRRLINRLVNRPTIRLCSIEDGCRDCCEFNKSETYKGYYKKPYTAFVQYDPPNSPALNPSNDKPVPNPSDDDKPDPIPSDAESCCNCCYCCCCCFLENNETTCVLEILKKIWRCLKGGKSDQKKTGEKDSHNQTPTDKTPLKQGEPGQGSAQSAVGEGSASVEEQSTQPVEYGAIVTDGVFSDREDLSEASSSHGEKSGEENAGGEKEHNS